MQSVIRIQRDYILTQQQDIRIQIHYFRNQHNNIRRHNDDFRTHHKQIHLDLTKTAFHYVIHTYLHQKTGTLAKASVPVDFIAAQGSHSKAYTYDEYLGRL